MDRKGMAQVLQRATDKIFSKLQKHVGLIRKVQEELQSSLKTDPRNDMESENSHEEPENAQSFNKAALVKTLKYIDEIASFWLYC